MNSKLQKAKNYIGEEMKQCHQLNERLPIILECFDTDNDTERSVKQLILSMLKYHAKDRMDMMSVNAALEGLFT